jgi:mRNA interferase MazF
MMWPLARGQVIRANIGLDEPKLLLVVSNNRRNRWLRQVLAVRLTTTPKPEIPSIVELSEGEPFADRVVCDDIVEVYEDEVLAVMGGLRPTTMQLVSQGLMAALGIDR